MKKIFLLTFFTLFTLPISSQEKGLDQKIDEAFQPVSDFFKRHDSSLGNESCDFSDGGTFQCPGWIIGPSGIDNMPTTRKTNGADSDTLGSSIGSSGDDGVKRNNGLPGVVITDTVTPLMGRNSSIPTPGANHSSITLRGFLKENCFSPNPLDENKANGNDGDDDEDDDEEVDDDDKVRECGKSTGAGEENGAGDPNMVSIRRGSFTGKNSLDKMKTPDGNFGGYSASVKVGFFCINSSTFSVGNIPFVSIPCLPASVNKACPFNDRPLSR